MRKSNLVKFVAVVISSLWLFGCASSSHKSSDMADDSSAISQGADGAPNFYGKDLSESEKELLAQRTFYFDYDRFNLSETDLAAINAHARYLKNYPQAIIRIEGHTDERGSREYNIALGENRAKTVAQQLMVQGIPREQINVVSFGKEKPAALGHDESAWQQNRRAIIQYEAG